MLALERFLVLEDSCQIPRLVPSQLTFHRYLLTQATPLLLILVIINLMMHTSLSHSQAIEEFKKGKVEFRADKTGIVHIPFGKVNFTEEDLLVNFLAAVVG